MTGADETLNNNARVLCNTAQHTGIIFQCWSRLTVNICLVISWNKCNKFVSSSMTQQYRVRTDPPNTVVGPKNRSTQMHDVTWFTPCSPETWRCIDETGQHYLLLHIKWRVLDQSWSHNSDRDIRIRYVSSWKCRFLNSCVLKI